MATAGAAAATALPTQGLAADSEPPDTEGKAHLFLLLFSFSKYFHNQINQLASDTLNDFHLTSVTFSP